MHKKALSPVCKALSTTMGQITFIVNYVCSFFMYSDFCVLFLCIIFVCYFLSGVVVPIAGFIYYDYATSLPSSATKNNVEGVTGKPRLQTQRDLFSQWSTSAVELFTVTRVAMLSHTHA